MSRSWLSAQGKLPLAFIGLGLVWLTVGSGWLLFQPALLLLPHVHPRVIAVAHTWLLGFFLTVACGAIYQLAPVALGTTLWSERFGWCHLICHALGVPVMVFAFGAWNMPLLGMGGLIVNLGVVMFVLNVWSTVQRSQRRGLVAWSLMVATGWLFATTSVGLLAAANRHWPFLPIRPLNLLRTHAHLGLSGFFLTLLQGVSFQLLPMFTLGEVPRWRSAQIGFGLSQAGLVALAVGLLADSNATAIAGGLAISGGVAFSVVAGADMLSTRKKRQLDPGILGFLVGIGLIGVGIFVGQTLLLSAGPVDPGSRRVMVYATILIPGGLLFCFEGIMCKIVPFLTWMRAYGPKVGRQPTPAAGALSRHWLERVTFLALAIAVALLVVGAGSADAAVQRLGIWSLALGNGLFLANMTGILSHLLCPVVTKASPVYPPPHD